MSKEYKNHIAHSGYTSSESDDDIAIIGVISSKSKREFCHSITPVTISESSSSSEDEEKLKRKHGELSNVSSQNKSKKKLDNQRKNAFIIDKRGIPEHPPVIDRNRVASSSSFAHGFNLCEVCNISFHTHNEYLMHMQDKSHQRAVEKIERKMRSAAENYHEANRNKGESSRETLSYPGYPPVPPGVTRLSVRDKSFIHSMIGNGNPPCPGLEHVTEIRGLKETTYFCGICGSLYNYDRIVNHLQSSKHQLNTLKALAPNFYNILARKPKSKRRKILLDMLSDIQKNDGIGRIVVEKEYLSEDRLKAIGYQQSSDTLGASCNNRGVPFYEPTNQCVPLSEDSTRIQLVSDFSKIDYYCLKCECNMFDNVMWESHTKRNPALRGIRKYPVGLVVKTVMAECRPKSEAFLVDRIDNNEPFVGLDYVREFQHVEDKKETYHCIICGDCSSCIDIIQHVVSLSHRLMYLEHINHHSVDYIRTLSPKFNKTFYIVEEICRGIQRESGPGCPEVFIVKNQKKDN